MSSSSDSPTPKEPGTVHPFSRSRSLHSSPLSSSGYGSTQRHVGTKDGLSFLPVSGSFPASEAMTWLHPLKQLPASSRNLTWLMALVSLGIHGSVLLIPIPSEQKPTPPKPEKQIRVTQLATQPKSPVIKAPSKPSPTPQKVPSLPKAVPRPRTVIPSEPKLKETPPKPKLKETPPKPKLKETPPEPKLKETPPEPKLKQTPPEPKLKETPQVKPEPAPSPAPLSSNANPWENFPKYPGAKPGCFQKDFCLQTGTKLDEVAAYFEKELPAKQYEWKPSIQEANRKVYQVSAKNGKTQFLSLIFAGGEEGTVYVLGENALSLGDFKKAVEVPSEISDILTAIGLESQNVDASYFTEPDKFYSSGTRRPEISSISVVPDQASETLMDTFLKTNLQNNSYEVSEPKKPYGGGAVYEVKKDKIKFYFNMVPTTDGKGSIVVIWGSPPG